MNIYLDIDGVLLVNDSNAANYADEFLKAVIEKYPESTYWLTHHNRRGENRAKEILASHLKPETIDVLSKVKPSEWKDLKTDAIDFDQDFLWFDDDLWPNELSVLERHEALQNFMMVDLQKDPDMLKKLAEVIEKS